MFRGAVAELGRILLYEAARDFLPVVEAEVRTPLAETSVSYIDPTKPVKVTRLSKVSLTDM